ncbi:hypothetical protein Poli38472_005981 [Pythium oligandrum]|uniref:HECT domain-containing protein n=1 Tax=Pythium oligandrum TaxID=41045 RepID=A0A8K1CUJ4_PYTOL|nr:hypothetical protein Poli38472_005981 [Pythium oligandrum]|eukprot:TMW68513.1 hypothetical protein Poli38472_005981 [Pythium oligandrum]
MNRAIRAVAAAILHHNMWSADAYAFAQNPQTDLSEHLVRGWNNAQKMRDWFHMGDATDVIRANQAPSTRSSSRSLRRQPSAFSGMTDEALETLYQNVIDRAQFLLELTPMTVSQVSDAKRRWSLLAKYGSALSAAATAPGTILQKWHNLVDEVQAVTELRSVLQYRRGASERAKEGRVMSVIEQVLAFVQSDVSVKELRVAIQQRNLRAESRALGLQLFAQSWDASTNVEVKGLLAESFYSTIKHMAATSSSSVSKHLEASETSFTLSARVHYGMMLSGCDSSRRIQVNDAFGACLRGFGHELRKLADANEANPDVIVSILKALCFDFDIQDAFLLEESKLMMQVAQFLGAKTCQVRRAAQTLLDIVLECFVSREAFRSSEVSKDGNGKVTTVVSPFQRQLYGILSQQLESVTAQLREVGSSREASAPEVLRLGGDRPGCSLSVPTFGRASHNHSISLWLRPDSVSPSCILKVNDVVKRGSTWKTEEDSDENLNETGSVIGIVSPTSIRVQWKETKRISEHKYDPTGGVMDVVHVDHNLGGVVFCKGTKALAKAPGNMEREVLATTENVGNLLFVAFHESVSIEARCASVILLQDLLVEVSMDVVEAELERVFGQRGFVGFVLDFIARLTNVWENDDVFVPGPSSSFGPRSSSRDAAALASAYVTLLHVLGHHPQWSNVLFDEVTAVLLHSQVLTTGESSKQWAEVTGKLLSVSALLGGLYDGIVTGGRVKRFIRVGNQDKEEAGYLLGIYREGSACKARVLFDSSPNDISSVLFSDLAPVGDGEDENLAGFWRCMAGFGNGLHQAIMAQLRLLEVVESTKPKSKTVRKENVQVLESHHPYSGGEEITQTLRFDGAEEILIEFDESSCSLGAGDSFSFKKRDDDNRSLSDEESSNGLDYWSLEKYDITSLPGVGENFPLRIPSESVDVRVCTGPAEEACWGYKLIAKAIAHTVVTPPDVAPSAILTAAADLRARLVKAVHRGIRILSDDTSISAFAPLVPALLKLAISPSLGQPTKVPSRSAEYESEHPYKNKLSETKTISFSGASRLIVTFDSRSRTETDCDVLTFYTDSSQTEYWGKKEYSGEGGSGTWPGLGGRDPLIISADSFTLYWKTDHSNVDWGWKFTVVAEYPPTSPGALQADELDKRSYDIWEL